MDSPTKESIYDILRHSNTFVDMFDIMRIVDAEGGRLLETVDGQIRETGVRCTDVFDTDERCKNCTSIRSFYTGEQVVKLEYTGGTVLLIMSVPISYGGHRVVAELVKDITDSMTVNIKDLNRADEVAGMIDNLNTLAVTDTLTGLYNRRYIDDKLPAAVQSCHEMGMTLSAAMVDIDRFKRVNDTHGHPAGDLVLKQVAGILQSFIRRKSDFVARYGGEEFFLCFPGVDLVDCRSICERIRKEVAATVMDCDGCPIKITVSIGIAESTGNDTAAEMIAQADSRLYEAKATGRTRVL